MKKKKKKIYGGISASASGHHIPMSAHKARRVIDQIRGRSYEEALMILQFMPYQRACYPIWKLVSSAAANACHNMGHNKGDLMIDKIEVNEGITIKKLKPTAKGCSCLIKRSTCHITVKLHNLRMPLESEKLQKFQEMEQREGIEKIKDEIDKMGRMGG
uniref:Large ribosomal subunit protein uL22c n=1 Tax=Drosera erythrorhiza TaxID=2005751 RepID=A0A1Z1GBE0_9CARY|nr:ribosomal protein L22 [Drosera erythrorhiza]ARV87549.1 ribosomal protein L22 [Drosera erythrorhiza]